MTSSPKTDFIELIAELNRAKGLDELSSNIIGILFIEPKEVSLEELSKRTGYSLSAVSTAMKMLSATGFIKRKGRPRSKKVYFFMEKDMIVLWKQIIEKMNRNMMTIKNRVPGIIEDYKRVKTESSRQERRIVEKYYAQVLEFGKVLGKCMGMCDDILSCDEGKNRRK